MSDSRASLTRRTLPGPKATVEALRLYQPDIDLMVVRDGYLARARRTLEERERSVIPASSASGECIGSPL